MITRTLDSQGLLFWGFTVLMKQGIWWTFSREWNGIMLNWVMTVPLIWWAAKENNVERISIGLYAIRKQLFLQSLYSRKQYCGLWTSVSYYRIHWKKRPGEENSNPLLRIVSKRRWAFVKKKIGVGPKNWFFK